MITRDPTEEALLDQYRQMFGGSPPTQLLEERPKIGPPAIDETPPSPQTGNALSRFLFGERTSLPTGSSLAAQQALKEKLRQRQEEKASMGMKAPSLGSRGAKGTPGAEPPPPLPPASEYPLAQAGAPQAPQAAPPEVKVGPGALETGEPTGAPLLGAGQTDEHYRQLKEGTEFAPEEHTPAADDKARGKDMAALGTLQGEAKKSERDERIAKAERWKSIAQGLGTLGTSLAALRGHLPPEAFQRPSTEAIDREIANAEDMLTDDEIQMLESAFGPGKIPKGVTRSGLRVALPSVSNYLETKARTSSAEQIAKERNASDERVAQIAAASRREVAGAAAKGKAQSRLDKEEDQLYGEESKERGRVLTSTREIKKSKAAAENAIKMIDSGTPQAIGAAMFAISKASGNVGAPSDRDINIVEGNYGVPGIMNKIERGFTGNFTDNQKKAFRDLAGIAKRNAEQHLAEARDAGLESFWAANQERASKFGRTPEKYRAAFGPLYGAEEAVTLVEPDGTEHVVRPDAVEEAMRRAEAAGTTLKRK